MILDPNSYIHFEKLKALVYSGIFDYSDEKISSLYESFRNSNVENEDWFDLDYTAGGKFESEGKGLDLDVLYIGPGRISVCQLYRYDINNVDSLVNDKLSYFREELKKIPGIHSSQYYYMNNIIVLEHIDDLPHSNIQRMIFPLEVPDCTDYNIFGLKLDSQTIVPEKDQVIFFDHSVKHSAWNLTGKEWKFLSVDILQEYIL